MAILLPWFVSSQIQMEGIISTKTNKNIETPIEGASVYWLDAGIGTFTVEDGSFSLPYNTKFNKLIISYVGYKTDTLHISENRFIKHFLTEDSQLSEIRIESRKKTSATSFLSAQNILKISSEELLKAACCNLSESFETNPSIDVNFTNAISGVKQIKMLGLTTPYILITSENIPMTRGAAQTYGMSFIPGTWVESIQISKGAGSVVNGFESIAGQINAELVKPNSDAPFFFNAYANVNGRNELNTHFNKKLNDNISTGLYVHLDSRDKHTDRNQDSFLDLPLSKQFNIMNRWQYNNLEKGLISFLNFRYLKDERDSGQIDHHKNNGNFSSDYWGAQVQTDRLDFSTKFGYVNPNIPYQSLGVQLAYSYHNQDSYFGERAYDIQHNSVYTNLVYNSIISDSRHKIKTGLGFTFDSYYEFFMANKYSRKEHSTGGFFEYNYDNYDNLNLTLGFRLDSHNLLGFFATPRLHVRYTPWNRAALRFSVGRGKRSANVFAENQNYLASSRSFQFLNSDGPIYGLDPEIAWNYGISFMQGFNLFGRSADIVVDFYKTDFENQVVVDAENPYELRFYNLQGKSYANSLQLEFNMSPLERLNFKSAFKYYDVKVDYINGRLEKPMTARQRFFTNISYESISNSSAQLWRFDATFNRIGRQRFPSTSLSPEEFKRPDYAPAFSTLNAQLTRVFSNKFELYLGGENITDTRQKNPIISAENPFGPNFDSTFVYGPVFGKSFYLGLRFKI